MLSKMHRVEDACGSLEGEPHIHKVRPRRQVVKLGFWSDPAGMRPNPADGHPISLF